MVDISYSAAPRLGVPVAPKVSARYLQVLSALCLATGSLLLTSAVLILWWPVSPVLLVVGAVVFWIVAAVTAQDEPVASGH